MVGPVLTAGDVWTILLNHTRLYRARHHGTGCISVRREIILNVALDYILCYTDY